jgi:sugar phosphate isomerase/epimerase
MQTDNMRRISVCQISSFRWTFLEDVVRYSNEGFQSIGIWRRKVEDFGAAAAIDLLYERKLSVSSVHWAGGFTGDGQSFADGIEDAIEAIQLASRMSAGCLIIHPGSRNGHTTSHAFRLLHSAINTLIPIATDYGVKLALEPIPGNRCSPWTFIENFEDTLAILDRYSKHQLGLVLDLHHVGLQPQIFEWLDRYVDRIELVQLADRELSASQAHRLPLGEGQLPVEAWLSKLQQFGYGGQFELEVHGRAIEGMDYFWLLQETLEYFGTKKINRLIDVQPQPKKAPRDYQLNREN